MSISRKSPNASASVPRKQIVTSMCGICPSGCGVDVELIDGQIERILPLKDHPMNLVCVRGAHSKDVVYSPDRLKYPMKRVGDRGEGRFERVSWDEAFDGIAQKMFAIRDASGPEAVMLHTGRGLFEFGSTDAFCPAGPPVQSNKGILSPFGSPNNMNVGSICYVAYGVIAPMTTIGAGMNNIFADHDNANLIVVWGANPATDSPPAAMRQILQAKKRGAKVVVIDHLRSDIAAKADQWIPIRSGTDGALALSVLNVIINQGLYDREFVQKWTVGFDELARYAQEFPPEKVETITRVPRDVIVELARQIACDGPVTCQMYTGLEYTNSGVQNIRAALTLWAITGNFDVPGGMVFWPKPKGHFGRTNVPRPDHPKAIGYDKYPLFCKTTNSGHIMEVPRAILEGDPYPIKGLIVAGASIMTNMPNPDLWRKCFGRLDLLVVIDRFLTADALHADYVLPATTYYETLSHQRYPGGYAQIRSKVVEPLGEARSDFDIFVGLAKRLGYGHLYPQTKEELLDLVFSKSPVSVEQLMRNPGGVKYDSVTIEYKKYEKGLLRRDGQPGFNTPSGKVEIASSVLASHGYDALPVYVEPIEGPLSNPELAKRYPLIFNSGARIQSAFRTQHLNIPALLKMQPKPHVLIHPQDASARGIEDGDRVFVETLRGRVPFYARVTDAVLPGAVEANAGGGGPLQPREWREANVNYLTDHDNRDPISGFPVYKALLCEVRKAEEQ